VLVVVVAGVVMARLRLALGSGSVLSVVGFRRCLKPSEVLAPVVSIVNAEDRAEVLPAGIVRSAAKVTVAGAAFASLSGDPKDDRRINAAGVFRRNDGETDEAEAPKPPEAESFKKGFSNVESFLSPLRSLPFDKSPALRLAPFIVPPFVGEKKKGLALDMVVLDS